MILVGANAPVRVREPPAGPPKLDLDFEIDHFFENSPISVIFGVMEKSVGMIKLPLKRITRHQT